MKPDQHPPLPRMIWNSLTRQERRRAGIQLALSFVGMFLETLGIGMIIPTMVLLTQDDLAASYPVLQPTLDLLGNPSQTELIIGGMTALGLVFIVKNIYIAFLIWSQNNFTFAVQKRLSEKLFTTYLRQPYVFHLQRNSAFLIRNTALDVHDLSNNGLKPLMVLVTESLMLIGIAAVLLVAEPLGALAVIAIIGPAVWGFQSLTRHRVTTWGRERREHEGLKAKHLMQGLGGVKDIKVLGREAEFLDRFRMHNRAGAKAAERQTTLSQLPRLGLELLAVLGLVVLVLTMVLQGRQLVTVLPVIGVFAAAAFRVLPSTTKILASVQSIRYVLPVVKGLYPELQLAAEPPPPRDSSHPLSREIRLENVTYSYPEAPKPTLVDLSLVVRKGETVGIIGPSGSGKSTTIDVLLGLLTPRSGRVLVDGEDIQDHLRRWQDQIGYVPQSIYLTDDTLRNNVAFGIGESSIDHEAIDRAIDAAQLQDLVSSLPDGLDTIVGERGVRLSGGQRQRIGIARALYHDPTVLVLDEATSALDNATEREVMRAVTALHGTKTIVIIAHRLSTVEACDRLYVLRDGRVAAEGAPDVILEQQVEVDEEAGADLAVSNASSRNSGRI